MAGPYALDSKPHASREACELLNKDMPMTKRDLAVIERTLAIRNKAMAALAIADNGLCPVCCKPKLTPFLAYDPITREVDSGCVDACHLDAHNATYRAWFERPEACAIRLRSLKMILA